MSDFPNNFDFIIYGTGVTESILSSALAVTGKSVLHIDKNSYYGGYNGCLRLVELESILNEWRDNYNQEREERDNIFSNYRSQVSFIDLTWHVKTDNDDKESNGLDDDNCVHSGITEKYLRQRMRGFEFELSPKLVYCESETVDALIQSDVTRYLEFKFVSKFANICDDKIINIPINRSDIVKTRVFSLRQKRQLTSFLEWCFTVSLDDDLLKKYSDKPLYELMRNEKNIDSFTENIILQCLALSSPNVETIEGTMQVKRLLKSFNKFGPYPIMWPNYGSGEIPQAFCRMSAVFGGIYCLNTSIQSCLYQATENGLVSIHEPDEVIPTTHRNLKLLLSNDNEVYTDKIICAKSYINPTMLINPQETSWVCRAILITDRSLLNRSREAIDILMLPLQLNEVSKPVVLLELPTERRNEASIDAYVVHLTAYSNVLLNAKELFSDTIGKFFERYGNDNVAVVSEELSKPNIFFECYFTLPDYSKVTVDSKISEDICRNSFFINSSLDNFEFEDSVREARGLFSLICPGIEFLPRPPNPEDIILLGDEVVQSSSQTGGDFPFESNVDETVVETHPDAPGDVTHNEEIFLPDEAPLRSMSSVLAEINLEENITELEDAQH